MTEELNAAYRARLVEQCDFTAFDEIAVALTGETPDLPERAQGLEDLLRFVVAELAGKDPAAAARAIDDYVAMVWPVRAKLGLGPDLASEIAREAGVSNLLGSATTYSFAEEEAERQKAADAEVRPETSQVTQPANKRPPRRPASASQTPEGRDAGGKETAEDKQDKEDKGQNEDKGQKEDKDGESSAEEDAGDSIPTDFAANAAIKFPQLCETLTRRTAGPLYRIVLVGMPTSGKTFFLRRLQASLRGAYKLARSGGFVKVETKDTGRTKDVCLFRLYPSAKGKPSYDIYDIPGDRFREVSTDEVDRMPAEYRKSIYALLATADLFVFVEPALQTLALAQYELEGDDIEHATLAQAQAALTAGNPDGAAQDGALADLAQRIVDERRERIATHENFINSVAVLAKRIELLRSVSRKKAPSKAEALQARIEEFEEKFKFDDAAEPLKQTVAVPALLLLSRADEYRRRVAAAPDFDRDPALALLENDPERYKSYVDLFDAFAVDFITSSEMEHPQPEFDKNTPHAGYTRILEDWALPAMRDCRQGAWRKWLFARRWLRHPRTAIRLRSWMDPTFRDRYAKVSG